MKRFFFYAPDDLGGSVEPVITAVEPVVSAPVDAVNTTADMANDRVQALETRFDVFHDGFTSWQSEVGGKLDRLLENTTKVTEVPTVPEQAEDVIEDTGEKGAELTINAPSDLSPKSSEKKRTRARGRRK